MDKRLRNLVLDQLLSMERRKIEEAEEIRRLRELVAMATADDQPDLPLPPATAFGPSPRQRQTGEQERNPQ